MWGAGWGWVYSVLWVLVFCGGRAGGVLLFVCLYSRMFGFCYTSSWA